MLKFQREGKIIFTESDDGTLTVQDQKLAEELKKEGIHINEEKDEHPGD